MGLGRVGIGLDRLRLLPGRVAREPLGWPRGRWRSWGSARWAPGKRATPSRSIAVHTERRIASFDLMPLFPLVGDTVPILPAAAQDVSAARRRMSEKMRQPMTEHRRILAHRPVHLLGRPARAGSRAEPDVEAIVGVDSEDPTRELERTEFVRVSNQHALIRRIVKAAEIDTVVDTRLVVDSARHEPAARAREQRDRDAQHPRRLLGAGLAGAQARLQELRALLRLRPRRPGVLHRGDAPQRTRRRRR